MPNTADIAAQAGVRVKQLEWETNGETWWVRGNAPRYEVGILTFFGIIAGAFAFAGVVLKQLRSTASRNHNLCAGYDDPEDRCPRSPKDCVCWQHRTMEASR